MSEEKKITLENFDYNNKGRHINSPFSKKALEFLGIEEKELLFLTLEEYISLNKDCKDISPELQKERYNNYFKKHQELINNAKEKRKEFIENNEITTEKKSDFKIYHCKFHKHCCCFKPKGKRDPNCEICKEYESKYEKLKERMKNNIQLEIDHEYAKKEKMERQMIKHNKCECTKKKEMQSKEDFKDKIKKEKKVKKQMELINE